MTEIKCGLKYEKLREQIETMMRATLKAQKMRKHEINGDPDACLRDASFNLAWDIELFIDERVDKQIKRAFRDARINI